MNWNLKSAAQCLDDARSWPVVSLSAVMVLILIVFWADITWVIIAPIQMLAMAGILFSRLRTDPRLWCVISALLAGAIYWDWYPQDNHQYLFAYMALALFCVFHLPASRRRAALALSARLLIGAVMAFAVIWKLATPDYLSGAFFHHELLTHHHLSNLGQMIGNVSPEILAGNREQLHFLNISHLTAYPTDSVTLQGSERIGFIAAFLTWWTIIVEALLALLFLWPTRLGGGHRAVFLARHSLLVFFIFAIYPLAPVIGFGWALIILGFAQTARQPTYFRPLYIGLLLFLLFAGYANLI